MSGLFRRKKIEREGSQQDDEGDRYLDLITKKVNDANGNFFGEVVSADVECFIIKHLGAFYRFPVSNVQNKFGDLMLSSNIDLNLARKQGDQWKEPGKDIIRENKVYDFSEKKRLEQERNDQILMEMEKARELALQTTITHEGDSSGADKEEDEEEADGESGAVDDEADDEITLDDEAHDAGEGEEDRIEDDEAHDAEENGEQKSSIDDPVSVEDDHTVPDTPDTRNPSEGR